MDLGGIRKGFAVDCVAGLALGCGVTRLMVDLGGDIAVLGEPPEGGSWYVGLEDPQDAKRSFCGIRLRGGNAVATSRDYRRRFELGGRTYGHIIDSRTGYPVAHGTRACSVIAPRCTTAGLLSTTAMVLGGRAAIDLLDRTLDAEGCVWHQGRLYQSRGFRRAMLPHDWESEPGAVAAINRKPAMILMRPVSGLLSGLLLYPMASSGRDYPFGSRGCAVSPRRAAIPCRWACGWPAMKSPATTTRSLPNWNMLWISLTTSKPDWAWAPTRYHRGNIWAFMSRRDWFGAFESGAPHATGGTPARPANPIDRTPRIGIMGR